MENQDILDSDKDVEEKPSIQDNISNFLRMSQEVITTKKPRTKIFLSNSQSYVMTSNEHINTLFIIAQKKKQFVQERETRRVEKKFTKHARFVEKQKDRETKEQRTHENKQGWQQIHLK